MRRRRADGEGGGKRKKKGKNWVVQGEWEWDSSAEFIIERLLGKMVADGSTDVPGRAGIKAGRPPIPPPPTDLGLSSTPPVPGRGANHW